MVLLTRTNICGFSVEFDYNSTKKVNKQQLLPSLSLKVKKFYEFYILNIIFCEKFCKVYKIAIYSFRNTLFDNLYYHYRYTLIWFRHSSI